MTQDNKTPSEHPSPETRGNAGTPWQVQNPDGSVHGGNGIQPASHNNPPDESQDEPLTE